MKRPFQQSHSDGLDVNSPSANQALADIREQVLRLDPDEQRILQRIVRRAARLDAALADLHLFLPTIEICFYGVRSGGNTGHSLSAQGLRRLIKRWDAENRGVGVRIAHGRRALLTSMPDGQQDT